MENTTSLASPTLLLALRRGGKGLCPKCGEGKLFRAFLKVTDHCPVCGEDFSHQRADDMPAWLTILIAGHLIMPFVVWLESAYQPPGWVHMIVWIPTCLVVCLLLLQPIKGGIVALQWHQGLHGFAEARKKRLEAGK